MPRRTKIVATLGPATTDPAVLQQIIEAGVDVVRLNFSHGLPEEHAKIAGHVRRISAMLGREVGVLADLQGPKIRIKGFREGRVLLKEGHTFTLDIQCHATEGDENRVGISYRRLPLTCPLQPCQEDEHQEAVQELLRRGVVQKGDTVITTCGDVRGKSGGANNMKIQRA